MFYIKGSEPHSSSLVCGHSGPKMRLVGRLVPVRSGGSCITF